MLNASLEFLIDGLCDQFESREDPVSSPGLLAWTRRFDGELEKLEAGQGIRLAAAERQKYRKFLVRHLILIDIWQRRRRKRSISPVLYDDLGREFEGLVRILIEESGTPQDHEVLSEHIKFQQLPELADTLQAGFPEDRTEAIRADIQPSVASDEGDAPGAHRPFADSCEAATVKDPTHWFRWIATRFGRNH